MREVDPDRCECTGDNVLIKNLGHDSAIEIVSPDGERTIPNLWTVVSIGPEVTDVAVGDTVVAFPKAMSEMRSMYTVALVPRGDVLITKSENICARYSTAH